MRTFTTPINKRMVNMLILEILRQETDDRHSITQQEILRRLKSDYDMDCDRRTVGNNISNKPGAAGTVLRAWGPPGQARSWFGDPESLLATNDLIFYKAEF